VTPTPTPACGNGIVEPGEQCDDGNTSSGDCCDSSCQFEGFGGPCDDGNACTIGDTCDGSGQCLAGSNAPDGTACDDGLFCNGADQCDNSGQCSVHAGDPCVGGAECNQTCNEDADNCFDPVDTPCGDDGLVCTGDACDGAGSCAHTSLPPATCPKGYVLLESPSSATVTAEVAYTAQVKDGAACAQTVRLKQASLLGGNAVGVSGVTLGKDALANGTCVTGGTPVSLGVNASCTGGTDSTGSHSLLGDCQAAADLAETRRLALLGLSAQQSFPPTTISTNSTLDVTPFSASPGAVVVIDYGALTVNPNRTLTIKGNANTEAVIVRVAGNLRVRRNAKVITQGISAGPNGSAAERVLFLVGGTAEVRPLAEVQGTIFSQGKLTVRRDAVVRGALISNASPLRVRPSAEVHHAPWVLW
jgi:cysteine-rich repeat protein